jgi:hypothetical protein
MLRKPRPFLSVDGRPLVATPFMSESGRQLWALPLAALEPNASDKWYSETPSVELLYSGERLNLPSTHSHTSFEASELIDLSLDVQGLWRQKGNDKIRYSPKDARRLLVILNTQINRPPAPAGPRQRLSALAG